MALMGGGGEDGAGRQRTREGLCFFSGNSAQVLQVGLVADEHNDDVRVGVVAQLLEPAGDVDIGRMLCNVVDKQCAHCTTIVSGVKS